MADTSTAHNRRQGKPEGKCPPSKPQRWIRTPPSQQVTLKDARDYAKRSFHHGCVRAPSPQYHAHEIIRMTSCRMLNTCQAFWTILPKNHKAWEQKEASGS